MSMPVIIDIVLVAIVAASVAIGAGRGAIRAVSGLAGTVLGALGAMRLAPLASPLLARVITPAVRGAVQSAARSQGVESILDSRLTQDLLQAFGQLLEALGLTGEAGAAVEAQAQAAGSRVVDAITAGLVEQIAPAVAFLVLFLVIKAAVMLVLGLLGRGRLPVITTVNKVLGGLLGLVSGLAIIFILCWGVARFGPDEGPLRRGDLMDSYIGSAFVRILDREDQAYLGL